MCSAGNQPPLWHPLGTMCLLLAVHIHSAGSSVMHLRLHGSTSLRQVRSWAATGAGRAHGQLRFLSTQTLMKGLFLEFLHRPAKRSPPAQPRLAESLAGAHRRRALAGILAKLQQAYAYQSAEDDMIEDYQGHISVGSDRTCTC